MGAGLRVWLAAPEGCLLQSRALEGASGFGAVVRVQGRVTGFLGFRCQHSKIHDGGKPKP